ncbi:STAS domain-containing protein [Actinoplanes derwentensis]|uniref:STAS domain-containing protein n=2 Tax=Actinoplanes derwentensis TaxID=113562 RepID=A0A1H1QQR0_9ACTN|nr:hypothetical protein Ade03nite_82810 [Actinoplanes derwentensis]SDS25736.1 STAS domain-containing protein [Actinoplanes derwentensis]
MISGDAAGLPTMAVFVVGATIRRTDIPALCAALAALLRECPGDGEVTCDVSRAPAAVVTVEALARLRLTARRHGHRMSIHHAGPALRELIILLGLDGTLLSGQPFGEAQALSGQPFGEAEQGEQAGGVEEAVD